MSDLGRALSYNIFGQMFARVVSFSINMYLLRVVNNDVLGIVNVRLALLYNTILFLTREPMRKASISQSSIPKFINTIWLSPLICIAVSSVCLVVWTLFSSSGRDISLFVLLAFPLSAFIESLAEPFAVISLRYSLSRHFAIGQSLILLLQRLVVFALLISFRETVYHLEIFAVAQVLASTFYFVFHFAAFYSYSRNQKKELEHFESYRSFFPRPSAGVDSASLSSVGTLFLHSILKQLLTDGSSYVMTFTELLSLKNQAVFDAVERLGSLVARILLAPLEENCYAEFSNQINKQSAVFEKNNDSHDQLVRKFSTVLHMVTVIGLVVCVFGIPYSKLAVWLYGGSLLADNGGAILLSLYSFYVFIMAVNGITECFAMASMTNSQVFSHGGFLLLSSIAHVLLNLFFCYQFNSAGFILANSVNMLIRIGYSWKHISQYLGEKTPSLIDDVIPNGSTFVFLVFTLFATMFSLLIFGAAPGISHLLAHIAVGGIMFLLLSFHIYHSDHTFQSIVDSFYKRHSD